jgi:hypothetical protein
MTAYIDPSLDRKIRAAGEFGPVEAILVVKEKEGPPSADDKGMAHQLIESAARRIGEFEFSVRYFPRANAAVIISRGRLIQEILKDENLAVASATEIDAISFLFP